MNQSFSKNSSQFPPLSATRPPRYPQPTGAQPPVADADKRALDTALVAGLWSTVDHLVFNRKISLSSREPLFRALVVDNGPEAIDLFKKLLRHELRLLQIQQGEKRTEIENGVANTLEEAIKHGNKKVLRIMLGDDSSFNQLIMADLPQEGGIKKTSVFSALMRAAGRPPLGQSKSADPKGGPGDLSLEMKAVGLAGGYGHVDLADLILKRVGTLGGSKDDFMSEAMRWAAANGRTEFISSFLTRRVSAATLGAVMVVAAKENEGAIVELLKTKCSASDRWAAALGAAANGHIRLTQQLFSEKTQQDELRNEALKGAAENGRLTAVKELLRLGAQATHANSEALRRAARGGHAAVCSALMVAGADPCRIPLPILSELEKRGQESLVTELVDGMLGSGRDISFFLNQPESTCNKAFLTRCIDRGLDLNRWGTTLMKGALESTDVDVVRLLQANGVDLATYARQLMTSLGEQTPTSAHQIKTLLLIAFNTSPGWSQLPDNLERVIENMSQLDLLQSIIPHLGPGAAHNDSMAMYDLLIYPRLKTQLQWINPSQSQAVLDGRIRQHYDALLKKTPGKKQFLNRMETLTEQLKGVEDWISEIADSLLLGVEQNRDQAASKAWTPQQIADIRSNLRAAVGEHLLTTHQLSDIARLYKFSLTAANHPPVEARPLLWGNPEWIPLVTQPCRAPNGYVISCLQNEKELYQTGDTLHNCIRTNGYLAACRGGDAAVFKVTSPTGEIVAAFELRRTSVGRFPAVDGSRWQEIQFRGPHNATPSAEATAARDIFYQHLESGNIRTNSVRPTSHFSTLATNRPIDFITGIPVGGDLGPIKRFYRSFGIPKKGDEQGLMLFPPGSRLYPFVRE